jgi:MFS family permease
MILIAISISSIGIAMFDTSMSWLMTRLNPNPLMVSAVQVATMAPMFLLTIPAGALADVADPRRLLIAAQTGVVAVGALFAGLVTVHLETQSALSRAVALSLRVCARRPCACRDRRRSR